MAATATRISRKRSHDDLEDADECLPISKRINSLHLEGKVQAGGFDRGLSAEDNQLNPATKGLSLADSSSSSSMYDGRFPNVLGTPHSAGALQFNPHVAHNHTANAHLPHMPPLDTSGGSAQMNYGLCDYNQNLSPSHLRPLPFNHDPAASLAPLRTHHDQQWPLPTPLPQSHADAIAYLTIPCGTGNSSNTLEASLEQGQESFQRLQLPEGPYNPELGVSENPHYFDSNRLLYEAHLSRLERIGSF